MIFAQLPMLVPMGLWDGIKAVGSAIMQPLYWVVSGILVFFHYAFSPLLGPDSGWTWALSIVGLYGFYLLYLGLPRLMKVQEDQAIGYIGVTVFAMLVINGLLMVIASRIAWATNAVSMIR